MICPKCGAQNMDGVTFCGSCGAQLESHMPSTPVEPQQNYNQPPVQQPQYQQQQAYGGQSGAGSNTVQPGGAPNPVMTPPKNYMTEAIIVTIISFICCSSLISLILGIIAIVKANNVNQEFARGNYDGANKNANSAKTLTIWAAIVAVIQVIIFAVLFFVLISLGIGLGGLEEIFNNLS